MCMGGTVGLMLVLIAAPYNGGQWPRNQKTMGNVPKSEQTGVTAEASEAEERAARWVDDRELVRAPACTGQHGANAMNPDSLRKAKLWLALVFLVGAAIGAVFGYSFGLRSYAAQQPMSEAERRASKSAQFLRWIQ